MSWRSCAALVASLALPCSAGEPRQFGVEFECTIGHECRITVSTEEGGVHQEAMTRFQADRLDTEGRYIHGVEEGLIEGVSVEGTYVMEEPAVEGEDGTFRAPQSTDAGAKILTFTKTFSLDPKGHCTFFHGVLRPAGRNHVLRHYTWGYPLGTIKEVQGPVERPPRSGEL
jgi:hypothetical protein